MPVYDYLCDRCGPFTEMKPMAEADLRQKMSDLPQESAARVSDRTVFCDVWTRAYPGHGRAGRAGTTAIRLAPRRL